jgi:16S rRNA (cytosine967-C5)-methyltransferase
VARGSVISAKLRAASARALAVEALVRIEGGAFSNLVLPGLLSASGLSTRDRALATDLVYGTLRHQGQADHLIALVADRPLGALDPPVRAALRLGVHQLLAAVPPHAAVGETVGALASGPAARARPYVNAVLRRVADLGPAWPWPEGEDPAALAVRTSHPGWVVELLQRDLGPGDALATLEAANAPPPVTLRPNPMRTTSAALATELEAAGVEVAPGTLVPGALLVRGTGDLARLAAVAEGRATPQDQASQAVAAALGALPGEDVLDLAAAPGGKATALAEAMGDSGRVLAADLRPGRARRVREASGRLGLASVHTVVADGRAPPVRPGGFDRVLLDAPCSGLGVLRRRPESRWRLQPADVDRAGALQRQLFAAAALAVRPGGLLAYSVCTLTQAETVAMDEWAAAEFPHLVAEQPPGFPWRAAGRGALLLPHAAGTDGMYLLLLRRIA